VTHPFDLERIGDPGVRGGSREPLRGVVFSKFTRGKLSRHGMLVLFDPNKKEQTMPNGMTCLCHTIGYWPAA
jgi:hypothetical protein